MSTTTAAKLTSQGEIEDLDVIIVGAGFAGLYLLDRLRIQRTDHCTYCPYKGDCAYFSIPLGGERSTNAVWTYEAPYAAVVSIKDQLAFYPDRVDAVEERP
jgi:Domain of unknown function (DUF427)